MWITNTSSTTEKQDTIQVVKRETTMQGTQTMKISTQGTNGVVSSTNGGDIVLSGVSLNISEEGKQKLEEKETQLTMLQEQLKQIQEQTEASEEGWDALGKCLTIALRISAGDNVPASDIQYLQEHNQELFMQAMSLRRPKKDPEDYDSVLEDEDKEGEGNGETGSARVAESGSSAEGMEGIVETINSAASGSMS